MRCAALVLAYVAGVFADFDNFPVKSISLSSAPTVNFYMSPGDLSSQGIWDVHPVHGAVLSDGSFAMVGKALEGDGSSWKRMFCVKMSATGGTQALWKTSSTGSQDAANAVLQLPNGGDILVVGYQTDSGVMKRSITKLTLSALSEAWSVTWDSETAGRVSAWEMISLTPDNTKVILAGYHESADTDQASAEMFFKSYGNVIDGKALVQTVAVSALTGASGPAASDVANTWKETSTEATRYLTSKAARGLSDGSVVALLYGADTSKQAALIKLSSTLTATWGPLDYAAIHGEGTDVVVSADGNSFMISGQGPGSTTSSDLIAGTFSGRLTKVTASDGTREWSKSYTSTPYDGTAGTYAKLIKNECWGLQAVSDGYVVGCGTGIEDCNGMSGDEKTACDSGMPDTRTGAVPRAKSVWQSMMFKVNLAGTLQWLRTDQYRETGQPALPTSCTPKAAGTAGSGSAQPCDGSTWSIQSSASEYPLILSDGSIVSINDEVGGIGLLKLNPASVSPSPSPPGPLTPPPAAPAAVAASPPVAPPLTEAQVSERTVVITFVASGSVEDYAEGSAKANTIKSNLANTAKVDASAVTLKVTAASVNIEAKILTASASAAATAKSAVAAEMGDAEAASAFLGVTVTATPSVGTQKELETPAEEPCFPSASTVTMADGTPARLDAIKEGDVILAATADGALTTGAVSLFSHAKPEAEATFVTIEAAAAATGAVRMLTLTPDHRVPVGGACCSELKMAKHVEVGETVWAADPTTPTLAAHVVAAKGLAIERGLHSPVLANGAMPVVDGVVTAYDRAEVVSLASATLPYALSVCKATGTCAALRRAVGAAACAYETVLGSGVCKAIKYIDGLDLSTSAEEANAPAARVAGPLGSWAVTGSVCAK